MICCALAIGQTNRGGIGGTVFDKSGSVVPGASVLVTRIGTNQEFKTKASEAGAYSIASLDPVAYRVVVEAPGFSKAIVENVKVDTATVATVDVVLQTGQVSTEVTVTAESAQVNTQSGTSAQTVTERQITDVPLVNRSVLDLAVTLPNISGDVGSEDPSVSSGSGTVPGFNLNVNGGRSGTSLMLADGVVNTGVGLARSVVSFTPETVQEFTVQTSAYSAEYGSTGGGVINTTTKSGTNQLSGTALWYTRNPLTNAAPYSTATTNRPVSNVRSNQFSLAGGGPVVIPKLYNGRNKTFFFGAFEPRRRFDHVQQSTCVPTEAMRNGDFSNLSVSAGQCWAPTAEAQKLGIASTGDTTIYQQFALVGNQLQALPKPATGQTYLPFPGNVIPKSTMDPVALKLLQYVPHGGPYSLDSGGNLVNYYMVRYVRQDETRYLGKIDQNISARNHLNMRVSITPIIGMRGFDASDPEAVNGNGADFGLAKQFMLADTHSVSPTVFNDLRLNYTRGRFDQGYSPTWDIKNGRNLSTELGLPSLTKGGLPMFTFELNSFGNIGSQGSGLNYNVEERYNVADTVFINRGRMTWKIGVDLAHALLNALSYYSASGGNYSFRFVQTGNGASTGTGGIGFASFLLGVPNAVTLASAALPYYYRWNSGAAFVQNDWKVRPNLTLNMGLRYSLQTPRTEKYNHQGTFDPTQAQSFPLATPVTLVTGQVITSALVPPFAFDGVAGRSPYLWPVSKTDFEPRFGFAWVPHMFGWNGDGRVAVRGGYGLSHVPFTGQNRLPNPNFGAASNTINASSGAVDPAYATRLSSNPPAVNPLSWNQILNIPANGLSYLPSLNYQATGFILSNNVKTPYSQNWNVSIDYKVDTKTVIEMAYVGNKGTHLFMPRQNINSPNIGLVDALNNSNLAPTTTIPDPLGRKNAQTGAVLMVQQGSLGSTYLGFNALYTQYNSSANSIRHATYVSIVRRAGKGLTLTANYTFGKLIDDASDSSPDKGVLTAYATGGEASFGGDRRIDRSVSTFDIKHSFNSTFLYDLPFGRGQKLLANTPRLVRAAVGGWSVTGVYRLMSGTPFLPTLSDSNLLGDTTQTHTMRPDIVPGVPLVNPLWQRDCPVGNLCEPYLNPAAFERPPIGVLGNAPRTLDGVRGPLQRLFDASVQKNFTLGESGKRRLQFRVDGLNVFNHPLLRNANSTDIFSQPSQSAITAAQYDTWAAANGKPLSNTPAGAAAVTQIQGFVTNNRQPSGALKTDYFTIPLPQGFALANPNSFDITTLNGFKLYRLKQAYTQSFGQLYAYPNPRYIQFGLKLFF